MMAATTFYDNDTRGWFMCLVSGIACVVGASIICVDILVQKIPSKRDFKIQNSNAFLAGAMSLSFGVMLFSSLYSQLPSSKRYLIKGGFSDSSASWILVACFVGGFGGIQIISKKLAHNHTVNPSNVVGCDHNHKEVHGHDDSRSSSIANPHDDASNGHTHISPNSIASESTALLRPNSDMAPKITRHKTPHAGVDGTYPENGRRPSMLVVPSRVMSYLAGQMKPKCDMVGPCYGYGVPCGKECTKNFTPRSPSTIPHRHTFPHLPSQLVGQCYTPATPATFNEDFLEPLSPQILHSPRLTTPFTRIPSHSSEAVEEDAGSDEVQDVEAQEPQHHHHVPENAFMNIGLQTSIAIAIHKIPEGFITYATNHANPTLGWSVFTALFFHNITEGFVLALPLYLALKSRLKAMGWAVIIGGVSQPLGAGIAASWLRIAGHTDSNRDTVVYGCMFAITAGVMTSVALQLFVEGLGLNHDRDWCIWFAFLGMSIMGVTNALTA